MFSIMLGPHLTIMLLGDFFDNCQSKSGPTSLMRLVTSLKRLENFCRIFLVETNAIVMDRKNMKLTCLPVADGNFTQGIAAVIQSVIH